MGPVPGPWRSHVPWRNYAPVPWLLSLCSGVRVPVTTTEPASCSSWSSHAPGPTLCNRELTATRSPLAPMKSSPLLLQLEESLHSNKDPAQPKINLKSSNLTMFFNCLFFNHRWKDFETMGLKIHEKNWMLDSLANINTGFLEPFRGPHLIFKIWDGPMYAKNSLSEYNNEVIRMAFTDNLRG